MYFKKTKVGLSTKEIWKVSKYLRYHYSLSELNDLFLFLYSSLP